MRRTALLVVCCLALLACGGGDDDAAAPATTSAAVTTRRPPSAPPSVAASTGQLVFESEAISDGEKYPRGLTCEGGNVQPPLAWSGVPEGAAELAILLEDLDAPGGTFTHLVVHGIPPEDGGLDREHLPPGAAHGTNDFGDAGYGGPCPPEGDGPHRYVFTLLAVGEPLGLDEAATGPDVRDAAADAGIVAEATITSFFEFGLD